MFNYRNLDDVEFEELCKDIMEEKLDTKLRTFRKGVDGGIDLKDNEPENNIIVQVKHYINSTFSDLKTSLKKEVEKVKKLNPNKYYICCSQELKASNIKELYKLFENYMDTEENIITLKEIDDFLNEEKNKNIVRKHFKLWLYSSNILSEINNQNIFIDCETLLNNIAEESNYYVQTQTYDKCIKILDELNMLMLIGAPGVGKTTISKMLILHYATLGYQIRYTTNGDVSDIKRSLSIDRETKEIILLDDCLGQYYFKIKNTQESELIYLINHIKNNKNKKIILNSRVTILNEAKERSQEFENFIINKRIKIHTIDMDKMSVNEKARIFYNHLYFNSVPNEYYSNIRNNKNYLQIINHRNYNPRIIEYVTQSERYKDIPAEKYIDFILLHLNNPEDVWKSEYTQRIGLVDRIFILILFSLTDTTVDYSVMEQCFNRRLSMCSGIDSTINNFINTLNRLNKSMIKIIDNNGKKEISVLNPSINDYIKGVFFKNTNELDIIRSCIMFYEQIEKCYSECDINEIIKEKIKNNTFLNIKINKATKCIYIETLLLYYICEFKILDDKYISSIKAYIENLENEICIEKESINKAFIIKEFLQEPLYSYYNIDKYITDMDFIRRICSYLCLKDLINEVNTIYCKLSCLKNKELLEEFINIAFKYISAEINDYIEQKDIDDFTNNSYLNDYLNQSRSIIENLNIDDPNECECMIIDYIIKTLYEDFKNEIQDEFNEIINRLEVKVVRDDINLYITNINLDEYGWENDIISYIESYFEPDYDECYDSHEEDNILAGHTSSYEIDEIENIFERDI